MTMTPDKAIDVFTGLLVLLKVSASPLLSEEHKEALAVLRSTLEWHKTNEKLPEVGEIVMWQHKSWKRSKEGYLTGGGLLKVWGGTYHKLEGLRWTYLPTPPEG